MHVRAAAVVTAAAAAAVAVAVAAAPAASATDRPVYKEAGAPVEQRVSDLLSRMSLDEKIGQMGQINAHVMMADPTTPWDRGAFNPALQANVLDTNRIGSILSGGGAWPPAGNDARAWATMVNDIQRFALEQSPRNRLGIPIIYGVDAVHGHNNLSDATMGPHQIGLGASFDPSLAERLGRSTGRDVRATGIPWDFAPVLDTQRDARWGRSYEPFGEDPLVNAELGSATIRGLQGDGLSDPRAVAATAKHFTGYSAPDNGHDRTDATISEAELRDIHLPPFARAIDRGVATVMINSGSVNHEPVHASHRLLTGVLRGELGFKGVAISDWNDVEALITKYHVAEDMQEALALAVNAGMDMSMIPLDPDGFTAGMRLAVSEGDIPQARIDEAVGRILTLKFRLGLFERPYVDPDTAQAVVGDPAHRPLARKAARESLVLLENDGTLPLRSGRRGGSLLVTGPSADNPTNQLGGWSIGWQGAFGLPADVPMPQVTTIREGIERAASSSRVRVDYEPGAPAGEGADPDAPEVAAQRRAAVAAARHARAVVVAVGEEPYAEGNGDEDQPVLPPAQARLVDELNATGTPVVLVLVAGRPLVMNRQLDESAASLMAFLPGSEGGAAVADALFGEFDPSGRLTVSWPRSTDQFPLAYNEPGPYAPRYAFGYGRSYARYSITDLQVPRTARQGERIGLTATVRRDGGHGGHGGHGGGSGDYTALAFAEPVGGGARTLIGFERDTVRDRREHVRITAETDRLAPGVYRVTAGDANRRLEIR